MKRFSIVNNGYDIEEVNKFVDIVIRKLELLKNEKVDFVSIAIMSSLTKTCSISLYIDHLPIYFNRQKG